MTGRTVLFYCAHPSSVQPYLRIADALSEEGEVTVVHLARSRETAAWQVLQAEGADPSMLKVLTDFVARPTLTGWAVRNLQRIALRLPGRYGAQFFGALLRIIEEFHRADAALSALAPSLVVVPDDRRPGVTLAFLSRCKARGIPSVLHCGAILSSPANVMTRRVERSDMQLSGWRQTLAKRLPAGARAVEGRMVSFFDFPTSLALWCMGLRAKNPWVMGGSGYVDFMTVQTEFEKRDILSDPDWKPDYIAVVGAPALDNLLHEDKHAACDDPRPLAIFAVPQHFSDAPNYTPEELGETVDALCRASFRVLLSVHPKEKTARYHHLLRGDTDSMISPQPLSQILPQADLFLASYSSTISWAGALGIPAAIIDYHEENAATYSHAKTIEVLRSVASVESWAAGLSEAPARRELGVRIRHEFSGELSVTGHAARDLAKLCIDLLEKKGRQHDD